MEPEKIVFPTDYPIKVVAKAAPGLRARIDRIFETHFGAAGTQRVTARDSAQQNFVALTYVVYVEREGQLGPLHADLRTSDGVVMVL